MRQSVNQTHMSIAILGEDMLKVGVRGWGEINHVGLIGTERNLGASNGGGVIKYFFPLSSAPIYK